MKTNKTNLKRLDILGNADCSSEREIFAETVKQWGQRLGYCSMFAAVPAMLLSHVPESRSDAKKAEANVAGKGARLRESPTSYGNPGLLKRQSEFLLPHQKSSLDTWTTLAGNDDCPGRAIPAGNYTAASPFIDSGDTTGANDTVTRVGWVGFYCYSYTYDFPASDHIYSFTLTSRGANPQIQVSTTFVGTYEPKVYILDSSSGGCSTGNERCSLIAVSPGFTATIPSEQMNFLPLNVPLHLFVDSARNDARGSGHYTLRIQDVTVASAASPNSIDLAEFFVRQHYADFLNRPPDSGGLAYWTNEIRQCGGDAACIHRRRVGVSAAFFIEQEFQETGYFVYRFYKASFGRQPIYAEFTFDQSRLIDGANLEARKQAFADEWVRRPAFVAAYPVTMSNIEFVNKLFDSAGLTAARYDTLRQQEILAMNAGRIRALVLRAVIEIPDFKNVPNPNDPRYSEFKQVSQYNPAFVLMQYFGYLRRNPDPAGYDFWLDVVNNRETNNYRGMVCAFTTSTEYQLRFGSTATRSNADCAQ